MAKRRSYQTVGGGRGPRASWWKEQLGTNYYSSSRGGSDLSASFSQVQRTNENISITGSGAFSSWYWELRDAETKSVLQTSEDRNPTFTAIATPGLYDIVVMAMSPTNTKIKYYHDAFYNHLPKPTEGECDIVVDYSSSATESYFNDFLEADNAGLIIGIKGSHIPDDADGGGIFYAAGLRSSDPDNPVRIVKLGDTQTLIKNNPASAANHTWRFEDNTENVIIDGYLPDGTNGIKIDDDGVGTQLVMIRGKYSGIHHTGITFNQTTATTASCVTLSPPDPTEAINATNYVAKNMVFFNCDIEQSSSESFYLGHFNDVLVGGLAYFKINGLVIARGSISNAGWDAVQIGAAVGVRVHDMVITDWGTKHERNHENAFSWNAGNAGKVFNNRCIGGEMFFNIDSGLYPYSLFDPVETVPRPSYFFSNIFDSGSYSAGTHTEASHVYIQNEQDTGDDGPWNVHFLNNTFIGDKEWGQYFVASNSRTMNLIAENNIIVRSASATGPELDMGTGSTAILSPTLNNIVRAVGSEADLLFTDLANDDFTLSSFESVAYGGSPTDIALNYPELAANNLYDLLGHPLRAPGQDYTFGAYSGFEKRTNDPANADEVTFPVAFNASLIHEIGFTLGLTASQTGHLYYVVLADAAASPTDQQVIEGLDSSDAAATASGVIEVATGTDAVVGLTHNTAYDVHWVYLNDFNIIYRGTKLDVSTIEDVTAPVMSDFWISSLNRDRLYFTTSEIMTGSTFTGFTFGSGKSASSVTFVSATKGYFTMNSAYVTGGSETVTYTTGSDFIDAASNALAAFGPVAVDNHITSTAEQDLIEDVSQNASYVGNDVTFTGVNPGGVKSVQGIPAGSDGYIEWQYAGATSNDAQAGLIDGDTNWLFTFAAIDMLLRFELNTNTGSYALNSFLSPTQGGIQNTNYFFRVSVSGADLITQYSTNGTVWNTLKTVAGGATGKSFYGVLQCNSTTVGKQLLNAKMQCDDGLIVDTE